MAHRRAPARSALPLGVVLAALIAASVSSSARPTEQDPFRTHVDVVRVPVTVRDSSGRVVATLSRDDFIVREDGQTKTLVAFDPPGVNPSTNNSGRQPKQGAFVVLLLDDLLSHPLSTTNIKRVANAFVAHMTDADVMAVTFLNGGHATTSRRPAYLRASIQAFRAANRRSSSAEEGIAAHNADAKHALDMIADLSAQLARVSHPHKVLVFVGSPGLFYPTDEIGKNGERTFSVRESARRQRAREKDALVTATAAIDTARSRPRFAGPFVRRRRACLPSLVASANTARPSRRHTTARARPDRTRTALR